MTIQQIEELQRLQVRMRQILEVAKKSAMSCNTCGHARAGFCDVHMADMPPDYQGPCDSWEYGDIPY